MMNEPVMNVVMNTAVAANGVSGLPWLQIGIVFVVLISGLVYFFLAQSNPSLTSLAGLQESTAAAILSVQDTTSPLAQLKTQTNTLPTNPGETWCFLGEDDTGRWCVKVPVPSLCEPSRSYGGRDPCEMTLAQKLPLGLAGPPGRGQPGTPSGAPSTQSRQMSLDSEAAHNPNASLSSTNVV